MGETTTDQRTGYAICYTTAGRNPNSGMEVPPPAAGSDWSALPTDMVASVLCELEFPDFIRSAAVCTYWRAAAHDLRRLGLYLFPQTPCLFYVSAASGGGGATRSAELYFLADKRPYTVTLPDLPMGERSIVGSSHRWLVTADTSSKLHLLYPVTRKQIELPSIATLEQVRPIFNDAGDLHGYELSFYDGELKEYRTPGFYRPDELRDLLNIKAVLSCDPSRGEDCAVLLIYHPYRQLSFARVGDKQWHWITTSSYCKSPYSDIAYRHMYMAWMSSGDVLQIWRLTHLPEDEDDADPNDLRTVGVEVYKADFDSQDIALVHDDEALFIGHNSTLCLSTKDFPTLLPNHVYFTDDDEYMDDSKGDCRDVGVFNLDTNSLDEVVSPQQCVNWPAPIWIMPSFTKM